MVAKFVAIGEPAHDAERQALRYLVEGLPAEYTVYGNPWLVERSGVIYELDALVVAPQAIFVVEIKSYRGRIDGTDNDWFLPEKIRSPLKLNRRTAQVLKNRLKDRNYEAGHVWIEGYVFLSATTDCGVRGPASNDRVHTRKTILAALQDTALLERLSQGRARSPSSIAEKDLLDLLQAEQKGPKPIRSVREYDVIETLEVQDTFSELFASNRLSGDKRVLRIYSVPLWATDPQRERVYERARWEAQVLGRLGRSEGVLSADPPFTDEAGIVLPLEPFNGITLLTWLDRYGPNGTEKTKANLEARTDLWIRIANTIVECHEQGVVHRLLRPAVILVEDLPQPKAVRVTGFDLAKQLQSDRTVGLTTVADERLVYAAPEVIASFSSAEPASDQFSLGAILGMLLTGYPLFENTRELVAARRLHRRVRDLASGMPLTLDDAVSQMLMLRPTERHRSIQAAIQAVIVGRDSSAKSHVGVSTTARATLDPDNLQPGVRVGTDYEITSRLGQGGMSVVYGAKHLVSGRTRALKIARDEDNAQHALQGEYDALVRLDHPNIVKVIDLTRMVEGRLTLIMERIGGENLRQWLSTHPSPEPAVQRRIAEDLLAGIEYLEQQGIIHKDLKPENLVVSEGRLVIIDFSLASMREDASYGGTALYRDPASARWTHATDRFAGALCLFELYAGRHAFDGRVAEPGEAPAIRDEDVHPSGLGAFFRKALAPRPEDRFASTRALRDALLVALGVDDAASATLVTTAVDASTPLKSSAFSTLSNRAINALARCQVHTVGALLALDAPQIRAIHAIGTKTANDIIALKEALVQQGLTESQGVTVLAPQPTVSARPEPVLLAELTSSPEPVEKLAIHEALRSALVAAKLPTIGSVASLTHRQAGELRGIGRKRLVELVDALRQFLARNTADTTPLRTLDQLWDRACVSLTAEQLAVIEAIHGINGAVRSQVELATEQDTTQPKISQLAQKALDNIDPTALHELQSALDGFVDMFGGIARLDELSARFTDEWPAEIVHSSGIVRFLVRISAGRTKIIELDSDRCEQPLVALPSFDSASLKEFTDGVRHVAQNWPPLEAETARRSLAMLLPQFTGDLVALGERLCRDVRRTDTGQLFMSPIYPTQSVPYVLSQTRDPMTVEALKSRITQLFGVGAVFADDGDLINIAHDTDWILTGTKLAPLRSVVAEQGLAPDDLPSLFGSDRSPEEVVRDMLREAANSRGFRMLVTPPERHAELGRNVAEALGAKWVSFEDEFFTEHALDITALSRAERFVGQRAALTEAAESTLTRLLDEHSTPGSTVVLGDTALLALCDALDFPRRLYDEISSGVQGFWVLVVPGVIHKRQPRFNEDAPMWHLEGATLPLLNPLI